MNTTLSNLPDSWNEADELISILRAWGIGYLVGLDHGDSPPKIERDQQSAATVIQRLAQCDEYPRVRDASIALFLLHPELADAVLQAIQESEPEIAERIAVLTRATLRFFVERPEPAPSFLPPWEKWLAGLAGGRAKTYWFPFHLYW